MKHFTRSDEENYELDNLAHDFTYQAVKYSELWKLLSNSEDCDKAADELTAEVREFVRGKIDQRVAVIQAELEARVSEAA